MKIIEYISPNLLKPDPNQPRQTWTDEDEEEIRNLAESYKSQGVIEPIEVDENNVIILGERRWRAAKSIGLEKIPVLRKKGLSASERFERQLIDDAHRKDLSPLDRAWAYATAIININTGKNYTVKNVKKMGREVVLNLIRVEDGIESKDKGAKALSDIISVPQPTIWRYLNLLKVEPETEKAFKEELKKSEGERKFTFTHLVEAVKIEEPEVKKELEKSVIEGKYGKSDDVKQVVSFIKEPKIPSPIEPEKTVEVPLTKRDKIALVTRRKTIDEIKLEKAEKVAEEAFKAAEKELPKEEKDRFEKLKREAEKYQEELKKKFESPEFKEVGRWFKNWLAHCSVLSVASSLFCPKCGKDWKSLKWSCCDLTVDGASDLAWAKRGEAAKKVA
jgi:ParB/RepB/Spo0J family partition protein